MLSRSHRLAVLLAAAMALPTSARAETAAEAAAAWGLVGTWAFDCRLPPSEGNGYLTYQVTPAGGLAHERDFGRRRDANEVLRAAESVGGLELTVYFPAAAQTRQLVLARSADGRMRLVSETLASTGEVAVRDGKIASTGTDTPWQVRCR